MSDEHEGDTSERTAEDMLEELSAPARMKVMKADLVVEANVLKNRQVNPSGTRVYLAVLDNKVFRIREIDTGGDQDIAEIAHLKTVTPEALRFILDLNNDPDHLDSSQVA